LTLGVGLSDGSIELWDIATLKLRVTLPGHKSGMHSAGLQFSPDGDVVASRGVPSPRPTLISDLFRLVNSTIRQGPDEASEVVLLDARTGKRLGLLERAIHPSFSPDGRTLAVRDTSLAIRLFDVPAAGAKTASHVERKTIDQSAP
jgi:WD40 repeat protein